ncbi:MAG: hypothetical protein JSR67_06075 [Proteobacteria bacterium]|nr:hypothetical protein [Pseudomonadota bacterium]
MESVDCNNAPENLPTRLTEDNMNETWRARFPLVGFILNALRSKAAAPDAQLLPAEQVLLSACEFWRVVSQRELLWYLLPDARARLQVTHAALASIGAARMASLVNVLLAECPAYVTLIWLDARAGRLEDAVLDCEDDIQDLIVRYSTERVRIPDGLRG